MQNRTRRITPVLVGLAATLAIAGCSHVKVQPEAEGVEVLDRQRASKCSKVGETRVSVATKFGFIARSERAIREDLARLARNSAADMGGDTVAPFTEIQDGKRTFGVFDCVDE